MNRDELELVVAQGEGMTVEFKRCGNQPQSDVFETVCSFANRQGGTLYLGVCDDGSIEGVSKESSPSIRRNIVNVANNPKLFSSAPALQIDSIDCGGRDVIRVWVPFGPEVYRFKGVVYDRVDDVDVRLVSDLQLSAMYLRKRDVYTERKVYPFLRREDLRLDLMPRVRQMIFEKRSDHPWLALSDDELIKTSGLYIRDLESGQEGYTRAAALLIGTDEVIMSVCPAYKVDALVRVDNAERYDDRLVTRTNLIEAYDQLYSFVRAKLPDRFYLEGPRAVSIRDIIVRELVANMLIHREYTDPRASRLTIGRNKVETSNPSRARFAGPITLDDFEPAPKNPLIASFFTQIGHAEDLGSGTRALYKYAPIYGGRDPELTDGDMFVARVYTSFEDVPATGDMSAVDTEILAVVSNYQPIRTAEIVAMTSSSERTVKRHLRGLSDAGMVRAVGSTRDRRYCLA